MTTNFWHIIHRLSLLCELKGEIQKAEARSDTMLLLQARALQSRLPLWTFRWERESDRLPYLAAYRPYGVVDPPFCSICGYALSAIETKAKWPASFLQILWLVT
ncbi:hypothetical protein GMDG_01079 [Pseudogymnoascus destructans 20631-21]|uniref:Uncharacterized protein n=1 Tax=Pseudogymnoascus destructans (strain ATCC MYA-4855 / 20631-21) TaxID=658429 RepID=L8FPV6_PSED2|nr:hypothetical protein GMDG_01079 [Pseudogymnoascus destructans 20631-21]